MALDKAEKHFHEVLNALARSCSFELDNIIIEIYDTHLSRHGYLKAAEALKEVLITRKGRDPFPSVVDVEKIIVPKLDTSSYATLVTNRIRKYIRTRGRYWKPVVEEMGDVVYKVALAQGGWAALCERANETDPGIFFAQLERSVKAVLENRHVVEKQQLLGNRSLKQLGVEMKEI